MVEHDWTAALEATGHGVIPRLLSARECAAISALYDQPERFRSKVVMARHGYGRGEYQYFGIRCRIVCSSYDGRCTRSWSRWRNRWAEALGKADRFPERLEAYLQRCHAGGQTRPTPLLLRYGPGDFNCLHQDLYGSLSFPFQVAVLLSKPEDDFTGGEFVLTQQRPRMQSRVDVVPLQQGDAVGLRGQRATGAGDPGRVPGPDAPRGERGALRSAAHPGNHLSRCGMKPPRRPASRPAG
jgi:hypothetical protein